MAERQWLLLLPQVPSSPSSFRVTIWRRMRAAGAVSLQNGVWVLPQGADQERAARELQAEMNAAGGTVLVMVASLLPGGDDESIISQFRSDRDQDYAEFRERCSEFLKELEKESAQQKITYAELEENDEDLKKLSNWLSKIQGRDFFRGQQWQQAVDDLAACQRALEAFVGRAALGPEARIHVKEEPQDASAPVQENRPGLLDLLAASVQGVFDIKALPIPASQQVVLPYRSALNLLANPKGTLFALRDGALTVAQHWTDALLTRGAELKIPGGSGLRIGDALDLNIVRYVWPGRASRLYQVDASSRGNPPEQRFRHELPITREQVEADDRPVALILHGFCSSTTGWHFEPLKTWLTDPDVGRYGLVLGFECDTVQRRLPDLAGDLREHLRRLGLLQGRRRLDVYSHSMGGVVARWLLENPEDPISEEQSTIRRSVRRLIMAGPPNLGVRMAELGDQLIRLLHMQRRFSDTDMATAPAALRIPLVFALARRFSVTVPTAQTMVQGLNDLMPGSDALTALLANSRLFPDSPTYYLIQGVYDPIPPGETVAVRLLREAVTLLGDFDPQQSDLIVDGRSQTGFKPFFTDLPDARPPQHIIVPQTWHHQYWLEPGTFQTIRSKLLDALPH
ncbi:MAG: hypothetical protein JWN15_424 [Firmicutes bacterium]|nr:hypothetical protein [Bacillota bacterium]